MQTITEFYAERFRFGSTIQLQAICRHSNGSLSVAQNITFRDIEEGECCEPFVTISSTAAQMLMDELWRCGLRPTQGEGSAGSLAATERHLKDMRQIAMGLLKPHGV